MRNDGDLSALLLLAAALGAAGCTTEERQFVSICDTALLCDDFESYADSDKPGGKWRTVEVGGSVVVSSENARSGSRAVKVTATSTAMSGDFRTVMLALDDTSVLPPEGNVLYGRAMLFVESVPMEPGGIGLVTAQGRVPGQNYKAYYRYGVHHPVFDAMGSFLGSQLTAFYDTPDYYEDPMSAPHTACWAHSHEVTIPVGRWTCFEWKFDGQNNAMQLSVDGYGVPGLAVKETGDGCTNPDTPAAPWTAPLFSEIYLGWESYLPDEARAIWIDDVVLATQPIGCPE
ncbi:hypothetical protein [Polyangium fumosum]|uniref:Cip1-like core domain-containing protein n=1 Tax=Polyangium fumosum TaxID=889272 RepID=A0A4U1IW13_9BACT|nr:hypothetical protein [Polyangium fumosum]TKC98211.1 hypothetical protein E8A74_42165 [Polyangium fumosum]